MIDKQEHFKNLQQKIQIVNQELRVQEGRRAALQKQLNTIFEKYGVRTFDELKKKAVEEEKRLTAVIEEMEAYFSGSQEHKVQVDVVLTEV